MESFKSQESDAADGAAVEMGSLRFRKPDRTQTRMVPTILDEIIPHDHRVRLIWDVVKQLDLRGFASGLKVQQGGTGRSATDVRLLVALWLWASTEGVGSARELERLCEEKDSYKWLCGGLKVNYHTLSDFRVDHEKALDELLTTTLAGLVSRGLVKVQRITQDGLRVRASAGSASFRRRKTLEQHLADSHKHVELLKSQREAPAASQVTRQQKAAQERAAREREQRTRAALEALAEVEEVRKKAKGGKNSRQQPRASTTDAQARVMKTPGGGFHPAYNVQLAADTESRAIVGVSVSNSGSDKALSEPMRQQVESRTGGKVQEHLADGGFVNFEQFERAEQAGVTVYAPPQANKKTDPYQVRPTDSAAVARWRTRMATPEAKTLYKKRAATSETVNADLRTYRGLGPFLVRGLRKATCVALWSAWLTT